MKTNMSASTITARISFGKFENADGITRWTSSKLPISYDAESKSGNISAKIDCHLTMDDGTVITAPAYGKTASTLLRMQVVDRKTGEIRPLQSGDVVTVSIPGTKYRKTASHLDKSLNAYILNDFHSANFFNFVSQPSVTAVADKGICIISK